MNAIRCLAFLPAILALAAPRLRADGCFVWRKGADIHVPSQKAVILYDADREDLILQAKYNDPAAPHRNGPPSSTSSRGRKPKGTVDAFGGRCSDQPRRA